MRVYRLCREPFTALDGEGARRYGGRWNRPGHAVVYCSSTRALAALEYLAHLDPDDAPADLVLLTIDIPGGVRPARVAPSRLDANWQRLPDHPSCRREGDAWYTEALHVVLEVPSAVLPEEHNVLINARHGDAHRITEVTRRHFVFHPRLLDQVPRG